MNVDISDDYVKKPSKGTFASSFQKYVGCSDITLSAFSMATFPVC